MGIGEAIPVEALEAVPEEQFGSFLRSKVYDMPMPASFVNRSQLWR
jgi:hypothetical protein